jgi:FtsZ-binding cell division protein ZapB
MSTMTNGLLDALATPTGMLIYFLGVASACTWHAVKHRWMGTREPIHWTALGIIMGISALVLVGMQLTQLASQTKACQREFNTAIVSRNTIRETNDRLSREHRHWLNKNDEAVADLIELSTTPTDPTIAALPRWDARRLAWDAGLIEQYRVRTGRYHTQILEIERQQDANLKEWREHPLPDPECGSDKR